MSTAHSTGLSPTTIAGTASSLTAAIRAIALEERMKHGLIVVRVV
jgi:hypothetical protein